RFNLTSSRPGTRHMRGRSESRGIPGPPARTPALPSFAGSLPGPGFFTAFASMQRVAPPRARRWTLQADGSQNDAPGAIIPQADIHRLYVGMAYADADFHSMVHSRFDRHHSICGVLCRE